MTIRQTYSEFFKPEKQLIVMFYHFLLISSGLVFITFSARIIIPLPFTPVPITLQTFSVLFIGALYGRFLGTLTIATYLLAGIIGLPLFQDGNSGMVYLLTSPTTGYLVGFLFSSFLVGNFSQYGGYRKYSTSIFSMFLGNLIIYFFGIFGLLRFFPLSKALAFGLFPFISGDILKIAFAGFLLPSGWKLINEIKKMRF